ncbi:MAG: methyltransferase domain-containing protein [bacterium]|nr:methyltransferase domain-containing protein [bacterium]
MKALAYRQLLELEAEHWWFRGRRAVCMALIEDVLAGTDAPRILDVGAGSGGFLAPLARLGTVTHTEWDPAMLAACRERGFARGVRAGGEALPFADASFDLVTLFDVLEHIERDAAALAEVSRVLRPGGHVFVHVPAHPWLYAENDRVSGHHRRYARPALRKLFTGAGFELGHDTHTNVALFGVIAPLVLGLKAVERVGLARGHTNLSLRLPRRVHDALAAVFRAESRLGQRRRWPLGHSLAALGRKPLESPARLLERDGNGVGEVGRRAGVEIAVPGLEVPSLASHHRHRR